MEEIIDGAYYCKKHKVKNCLVCFKQSIEYEKQNPERARIIKHAVKKALTQYRATFEALDKN